MTNFLGVNGQDTRFRLWKKVQNFASGQREVSASPSG